MARITGFPFSGKLLCTDKRTNLYKIQNGIKTTRKKSDKPATIPQLAQRMKFKMATELACKIIELNLGNRDYKRPMTPVNMMCKHIQNDVIIGEYPAYSIDCAKLSISKGIKKLNCIDWIEAKLLPGYILELQWKLFGSTTECPAKDDAVHVLLYSQWRNDFAVFKNAAICGDLSTCLPLSSKFTDEALHCWVFVTRDDGRTASRSKYLGEIK